MNIELKVLRRVMYMKKVDNKNIVIGNKLKQLRISKGYTQLKIAEILGVSPQHYGTLERGVNAFSLENIFIFNCY